MLIRSNLLTFAHEDWLPDNSPNNRTRRSYRSKGLDRLTKRKTQQGSIEEETPKSEAHSSRIKLMSHLSQKESSKGQNKAENGVFGVGGSGADFSTLLSQGGLLEQVDSSSGESADIEGLKVSGNLLMQPKAPLKALRRPSRVESFLIEPESEDSAQEAQNESERGSKQPKQSKFAGKSQNQESPKVIQNQSKNDCSGIKLRIPDKSQDPETQLVEIDPEKVGFVSKIGQSNFPSQERENVVDRSQRTVSTSQTNPSSLLGTSSNPKNSNSSKSRKLGRGTTKSSLLSSGCSILERDIRDPEYLKHLKGYQGFFGENTQNKKSANSGQNEEKTTPQLGSRQLDPQAYKSALAGTAQNSQKAQKSRFMIQRSKTTNISEQGSNSPLKHLKHTSNHSPSTYHQPEDKKSAQNQPENILSNLVEYSESSKKQQLQQEKSTLGVIQEEDSEMAASSGKITPGPETKVQVKINIKARMLRSRYADEISKRMLKSGIGVNNRRNSDSTRGEGQGDNFGQDDFLGTNLEQIDEKMMVLEPSGVDEVKNGVRIGNLVNFGRFELRGVEVVEGVKNVHNLMYEVQNRVTGARYGEGCQKIFEKSEKKTKFETGKNSTFEEKFGFQESGDHSKQQQGGFKSIKDHPNTADSSFDFETGCNKTKARRLII